MSTLNVFFVSDGFPFDLIGQFSTDGVNWSSGDLYASAAVDPAGGLTSFISGTIFGTTEWVFFLNGGGAGSQDDVVALWTTGNGSWNVVQPRPGGAPLPAQGSALTGFNYGGPSVYYLSSDGHVQQLYNNSGSWQHVDVTAATGAPAAAAGSALVGWVHSNTADVYYLDSSGVIHEVYYSGGWHHTLIGATAKPGSPLVVYDYNATADVYYLTSDGHVHEAYYVNNVGWNNVDLTATTGAPVAAAGSTLTGNVFNGPNQAIVYYEDVSNHLQELYYDGSWHHFDVTSAGGCFVSQYNGSFSKLTSVTLQ